MGQGASYSASGSDDQLAGWEQYVWPMSAHDMVALATSLLADPQRGPSLRDKMTVPWFGGHKENWEVMRSEVRATYPHLSDACATGVALALLPLNVITGEPHNGLLWFDFRNARQDSEAVATFLATFYAALEQPTCSATELKIIGAPFGTVAAAAQLGCCLNVNSTIQKLEINEVDDFCAEAVWSAFSHALTSNTTLRELWLFKSRCGPGNIRHMGATLVDPHKFSGLHVLTVTDHDDSCTRPETLEDMEAWGTVLKHNRTITRFHLRLGFQLPQGGGLLVPLCEALLTNTTLTELQLAADKPRSSRPRPPPNACVDEQVTSIDDDAHSLAAMLRTNRSLTYLDTDGCGLVWRPFVLQKGLSQNNTLETLHITVDAAGAQALMTLLSGTSSAGGGSHLKRLVLPICRVPVLGPNTQCFPTATALGDMLASNDTLTYLGLYDAPYNNQEWATTILPALVDNHVLKTLNLFWCRGVSSGSAYDAMLELLDANKCITEIDLRFTPLETDGKAEVVATIVKANSEYRAELKNVPTVATTSCRLVLCGYPFAGKSTLLQTMLRRHSSHILPVTATQRTRGIDIQQLTINDLTMWVWDFAGQREFHPLQDFIFPSATSVHAATAFVFTFNPISSTDIASQVCLKGKRQFQQEFSYWLRFVCSNSKPWPSHKYKPLVLVVVTHKDQVGNQTKVGMAVKEWVRDPAIQYKDMVSVDVGHVFFVDARHEDDLQISKFECEVINLLRTRISNVPEVPAVCDVIAKALGGGAGGGGQQLEPIISFEDFRKLCKSAAEESISNDIHQQQALVNLFNTAGDEGCKVVAAYLRDAGEILYFSDMDFIVRNPRWFAHGILGHLIDIFPEDSTPLQDHEEEQSLSAGEEMFENGLVTKDFLTEVLQEATDAVGLNPAGTTHTDQLILLMQKLDLCYETPQGYLIPALFKDECGKAEKGQCKRKWTLYASATASTCCFVIRRLQCSDPFRTFITPGFFPRLQVVSKNKADEWEIEFGPRTCTLEKGFSRLILNDMEILVEFSGYFDYFVDIMVKSYKSSQDTEQFLKTKIISEIRRLCASPKGCQGVTLVEAIIRPDCVAEDITLCRFRQCVQVATLEQQIVSAPNLNYFWPAVVDEHGHTVLPATFYKPQDLLNPDWIGWKQVPGYPDSNVDAGRRRGVAVIVSFVKYNTGSGDRSGGHEDKDKLTTLVGELQFEVKLLQDSKAGELQKQLKEIAATSTHAQDESFLCFVMGHGDSTVDGEHFMLDQDGDMIMWDDIVRPFKMCEHLQGKPKVFFVVSCRGGNLPLVFPQPQVHAQQPTQLKFSEGTEVRYLHELTDCLTVFSTSVGSPSTRYSGYGTTFVGALVTNFTAEKRQAMDVLGILHLVNEEVSIEEHKTKDGTTFGQCPVVSHTLTKPLYWKSRAV